MDNKWYYLLILILIIAVAWYTPILFNSKGIIDTKTEVNFSYHAEKEFNPDLAEIIIAVSSSGNDLDSVFADNNQKIRQVEEALKEADIISYNTMNYQLLPLNEEERDEYKIINQLRIKTANLEGIAKLIDTLIYSGANEVLRIDYLLKDMDKKIEEVRSMALAGINRELTSLVQEMGYKDYQIDSLNINDFFMKSAEVHLSKVPGMGNNNPGLSIKPTPEKVNVNINVRAILW